MYCSWVKKKINLANQITLPRNISGDKVLHNFFTRDACHKRGMILGQEAKMHCIDQHHLRPDNNSINTKKNNSKTLLSNTSEYIKDNII